MKISKSGFIGLALGSLLLLGAEVRAATVSFVTTGTFTGGEAAGSSSYILNDLDPANRIQIDFNTVLGQVVEVPPSANVSFGLFDTSLTTATSFQSVSSGFILDIFQLTPDFGTTTFVGSLSGQLQALGSQAYVQFDPTDLLKFIGSISYEIVSADDSILGRVNIPVASSNPTSIAGRINAVPEPSTVILMGVGAMVPIALRVRRMKVRASA